MVPLKLTALQTIGSHYKTSHFTGQLPKAISTMLLAWTFKNELQSISWELQRRKDRRKEGREGKGREGKGWTNLWTWETNKRTYKSNIKFSLDIHESDLKWLESKMKSNKERTLDFLLKKIFPLSLLDDLMWQQFI